MNAALGLIGRQWRRVDTPAGRVQLRRDLTPHIVEKRGDARERYANRLLKTLTEPNEVWWTYYENGQFRRLYIKAWDDGRGGLGIVAEETREGDLFWNFVPMTWQGVNKQRMGTLVYPAGGRGS